MYFKGDPLYPFGYGLSYTSFRYANLKSSSEKVARDGTVVVSVEALRRFWWTRNPSEQGNSMSAPG
jgi:hypothetical protein